MACFGMFLSLGCAKLREFDLRPNSNDTLSRGQMSGFVMFCHVFGVPPETCYRETVKFEILRLGLHAKDFPNTRIEWILRLTEFASE